MSTLAWFTAALLGAYLLLAVVAVQCYGRPGLMAASIAAAVCWVAGAGALACVIFTSTTHPVAGLLGSMLIRTFLTLGCGIALQETSPELARAKVLGMILVLYLVTLVVETALSLRLVRLPAKAPRAVEAP